jgi:hypothetical protein
MDLRVVPSCAVTAYSRENNANDKNENERNERRVRFGAAVAADKTRRGANRNERAMRRGGRRKQNVRETHLKAFISPTTRRTYLYWIF